HFDHLCYTLFPYTTLFRSELAELGYSEVQLLGQTVNSYADPTSRKMRFSELLLAVAEVQGIRRVRFTTSHPSDFTPDIVEAIERSEEHTSELQSLRQLVCR